VISGSLNSYQTIAGIKDFNDKYLSVVETNLKQYRIIITGRKPDKRIVSIANQHKTTIEIVPNPENIFPVIDKASIYLCPTCIGGGLKLRVMDGLKMGKPVLVHSVSSRGYDDFFDKPYFKIYNDEDSFKRGLIELIAYINNSDYNTYQIQEDYYKSFSFESGTKKIKDILI
jgi:glycosyltransferase involved in cell wall biosynthesis